MAFASRSSWTTFLGTFTALAEFCFPHAPMGWTTIAATALWLGHFKSRIWASLEDTTSFMQLDTASRYVSPSEGSMWLLQPFTKPQA
jgi:hypothetical protein